MLLIDFGNKEIEKSKQKIKAINDKALKRARWGLIGEIIIGLFSCCGSSLLLSMF